MKRHNILIALLMILGLAAGLPAPAQAAPTTRPSVVIVHGAFADGSDWARVIPLLQEKGVSVQAVQNPLESLAGDVAATTRAIDNQPGNVVLVGHSWGGMVITEAGDHPKVANLVYVGAFAPDVGQSIASITQDQPPSPGVEQAVTDRHGWLNLPPQAVARYFTQDVPAERARVMAATQGPIKATAFGEAVSTAAWRSKPSWYIVNQNDRMILPELERAMARHIGARITELPTSHVPQQSRPADVARVILEAVDSVEYVD
ncbi:alpha/beta fold hydrolase [Alloalcanivorax xenomutans]|uniref:alpha/beta fold hydrolase n=1 Tax=Alloalcanivorax xenomutans TaxID=1094342 RepID=UPI003BAA63DF